MQTNHLGWYIRSSWMIEIVGIPYHKENCIQLISKLAELMEITNFNKNQTDLAHRISTKTTAPITILFHKKSDRINFCNERKKIKLRSGYFQIGIDMAVMMKIEAGR